MEINQREEQKIMLDRISTMVTAGGGSGYYRQIDPQKLAEVLVEIANK